MEGDPRYRPFVAATPDIFKELPTHGDHQQSHHHFFLRSEMDKEGMSNFEMSNGMSSLSPVDTGLINPLSTCLSNYSFTSGHGCHQSLSCSHLGCTSSRMSNSMSNNGACPSGSTDIGDLSGLSTTYSDLTGSGHNVLADYESPVVSGERELGHLGHNHHLEEDPTAVWCALTDTIANNLRNQYIKKHGLSSGGPSNSSCLTTCSRSRCWPRLWPKCTSVPRRRGHCLMFLTVTFALLIVLIGSFYTDTLSERYFSSSPNVHGDAHFEHFRSQRDKWWQEAVFYEIFPASFLDTDDDGFGDLKGLRQQIPYLRSLGLSGLRLNSLFAALDYPYQYEHVIDFEAVDPHLGDLEDFKALVSSLHGHKMSVVLDINLAMTSDQHPWAANWLMNRSSEHANFYANNRETTSLELTSSTATDRESRELEEIHLSFGGRLMLNWSNLAVVERMFKVLEFWLDLGVDGFYLKNLELLQTSSGGDAETGLDVFQVLERLNHLLKFRGSNFANSSASPSNEPRNPNVQVREGRRILIAGRESLTRLADKVRKNSKRSFAHSGDLFEHFHLVDTFLSINLSSIESIRDQVNEVFLNERRSHPWTLWNIGSATSSRLATRIGPKYSPAASFLLAMMPGSVSLMYGDELPLRDSVSGDSDKEYRGGQLCPMAWTSSAPSGAFSPGNSSLPWLPSNRDYAKNNVQRQTENVQRVQRLVAFRKSHFIPSALDKQGNYLFHYINGGEIVFERYFTLNSSFRSSNNGDDRDSSSRDSSEDKKSPSSSLNIVNRARYVLFANLAAEAKTRDLKEKFHSGSIKVTSNSKRMRDFLYLRSLRLDPGEAIIAQVE